MEFHLLGPVEAHLDGKWIDLGPPRQRRVLAALAVDAGRPVSVDALIDRVWDEDPPRRARHALYVYIGRIRKVIESYGNSTSPPNLIRRSPGYLLDINPSRIDIHGFKSLVAWARDAPHDQQLTYLRDAMRLWRDPPLANIPGNWAVSVREIWQQDYLDTAISWADAELRSANAARVVGPLTELLTRHPLAESVAAALMRALHSAGRPADALHCFTRCRSLLVSELGVEPGVEMRDLHQAILRGAAPTPKP